jgi:hypothetical protein
MHETLSSVTSTSISDTMRTDFKSDKGCIYQQPLVDLFMWFIQLHTDLPISHEPPRCCGSGCSAGFLWTDSPGKTVWGAGHATDHAAAPGGPGDHGSHGQVQQQWVCPEVLVGGAWGQHCCRCPLQLVLKLTGLDVPGPIAGAPIVDYTGPSQCPILFWSILRHPGWLLTP